MSCLKKTASIAVAIAVAYLLHLVSNQAVITYHSVQRYDRADPEYTHFGLHICAIIVVAVFNFFWNTTKFLDVYFSLMPVYQYYSMCTFRKICIMPMVDFEMKNFLISTIFLIWSFRRFFAKILGNWSGFPELGLRITERERAYKGKRALFWLWEHTTSCLIHLVVMTALLLPAEIFFSKNTDFYMKPQPFSFSDDLCVALMLVGTFIAFVADRQLSDWNKNNAGVICDSGLRRYLRYPQYLAELMFWAGSWGFSIAPYDQSFLYITWIYPFGIVFYAIWILFKITANDRILAKFEGASLYRSKVQFALIPFFRI